MDHLQVQLDIIHCDQCETKVRTVVHRVLGPECDITITNNKQVDIAGDVAASVKPLIKRLAKAGFVVLSWELFSDDATVAGDLLVDEPHGLWDVRGVWHRVQQWQAHRSHMAGCKHCQRQHDKDAKDTTEPDTDLDSAATAVAPAQWRAVIAVGGMTCALCLTLVHERLREVLPPGTSVSVDLMQHSAAVVVAHRGDADAAVAAIGDMGFDARLLEVLPLYPAKRVRIDALIGGITCAACATLIQLAVGELPFVLDVGINVVTKMATFVVEAEGPGADAAGAGQLLPTLAPGQPAVAPGQPPLGSRAVAAVRQAVEECGFEFTLLREEEVHYTLETASREVTLEIAGMYCHHCPELVAAYFAGFGDAVAVVQPPSLAVPEAKLRYIPTDEVNLRRFIREIAHLQGSGEPQDEPGALVASLKAPATVDDELRRMARAELVAVGVRLAIATVFAVPTFVFGVVAMALLPKSHPFRHWTEQPLWVGNVSRNTWALLILATPVYFFAADIFHRKAVKELRLLWLSRSPWRVRLFKFGLMSLLMCLGTLVAYFASVALLALSAVAPRHAEGYHLTYFDSVVFLTFFLLIGRLLEGLSKAKTAALILALLKSQVTQATLLENVDGLVKELVVPVAWLEAGDVVRVALGELPPRDCVVVSGESLFDELALTGESRAVHHAAGDRIFLGTVNCGLGLVQARVLAVDGLGSLLDQIVATVRQGQMNKAPIERTADRLTGYFVPVIVLFAVVTFVVWLGLALLGALPAHYLDTDVGGWPVWLLQFAIAVFCIACPCGIGLAAPTALFVGSGLAANHGILARGGGAAFQDAAKTLVVCFDKTGTLTRGQLTVTDYKVVAPEGWQVARDLELASKHPIATAVREFVEGKQALGTTVVPEVDTVAGRGLRGRVVSDLAAYSDVSEAILGNEALMADHSVALAEEDRALLLQWKQQAKLVVLVAIRKANQWLPVMFLALRDEIRPETRLVVAQLTRKKIACWMITGDNRETAQAIAKDIGIDPARVVAEVVPLEKLDKVKEIQELSGRAVVAMVGDGINDAPALALADVGIALSLGADLAVTSSDFILLLPLAPLLLLYTLFDLSRVVFRRVRFNFGWALVYNMIGVPIAAGVLYPYKNTRLDPVWAAAAMALLSISVVLSSLALRLYRPKKLVIDEAQVEEAGAREWK